MEMTHWNSIVDQNTIIYFSSIKTWREPVASICYSFHLPWKSVWRGDAYMLFRLFSVCIFFFALIRSRYRKDNESCLLFVFAFVVFVLCADFVCTRYHFEIECDMMAFAYLHTSIFAGVGLIYKSQSAMSAFKINQTKFLWPNTKSFSAINFPSTLPNVSHRTHRLAFRNSARMKLFSIFLFRFVLVYNTVWPSLDKPEHQRMQWINAMRMYILPNGFIPRNRFATILLRRKRLTLRASTCQYSFEKKKKIESSTIGIEFAVTLFVCEQHSYLSKQYEIHFIDLITSCDFFHRIAEAVLHMRGVCATHKMNSMSSSWIHAHSI